MPLSNLQISFCLPEDCLPSDACREAWAAGTTFPSIEYTTCHNWIYQTWNFLREAGIFYNLSTQLLNEGIIIALGGSLNRPEKKDPLLPRTAFFVNVQADGVPSPGAQLSLVQNKTQAKLLPNSLFVPHWPQPHFMPRDPARGNRFENIFYFGNKKNLAPELRSQEWRHRLQKELGIFFHLRGNTGWHDYRDVDGVVAIRDFSKEPHFNKPATKLYNAWLAGVPFIGGCDSAYTDDGHPDKDYLVATSLEEVFQQLKRLKEEESFRTNLVRSGAQSGAGFTREATLERWKKLLQETIPSLAHQWQIAMQ